MFADELRRKNDEFLRITTKDRQLQILQMFRTDLIQSKCTKATTKGYHYTTIEVMDFHSDKGELIYYRPSLFGKKMKSNIDEDTLRKGILNCLESMGLKLLEITSKYENPPDARSCYIYRLTVSW